jgi:hypothetical protein
MLGAPVEQGVPFAERPCCIQTGRVQIGCIQAGRIQASRIQTNRI